MFNKDIRIAFFGNSDFSRIVLEELKKQGILVDCIVTTPDKPVGRKMILTPTPTKVWAENNSIEYCEPEKLKDENFLQKISEYNLFIVASYGKIIPKILIDMPKYHTLNIHPSLLPKYRGSSPLQDQILNDEKFVGVSIMLIDEQIDHGAIVAQKKVDIPGWPVGFNSFSEILGCEGARLLAKILPDWIRGTITSTTQNDSEATFTKKVEKADGKINLSGDVRKNYLKYLAYENWPGTFFEMKKDEKIFRVLIKKANWKVNGFEIERVLPEGKKEMSYADFLRGQK
jgi:methionyl-tRNA formyltransferase